MTDHPTHALAQINVARALAPLDDPLLADFFARLDAINQLAEQSPGFIWRWTDDPPPTFDPRMLINITLWSSVDALADFTYRSAHAEVFKQRKRWFAPPREAHSVLWWVPADHRPSLAEAFRRLRRLRAEGPSPEAFTFKQRFDPPA